MVMNPARTQRSFFETLWARRSVRSFTSRRIEPDTLRTILESANRAPSAGNIQAYQVYAVSSRFRIKELVHAALEQDFIAQAPLVLVFCANPEASAKRYGQRGRNLYALQDATIACAYAQLAVAALGLGSVWVGSFDENAVRQILEVPQHLVPMALLPIGYPAEEPEVSRRRGLEELVYYIR